MPVSANFHSSNLFNNKGLGQSGADGLDYQDDFEDTAQFDSSFFQFVDPQPLVGDFAGVSQGAASVQAQAPSPAASNSAAAAQFFDPGPGLGAVSAAATVVPVATVSAAVSSAQQSVTAQAGTVSAVPAWVSSLANKSIATDMAAADVNGTVTYAGLEKLISDLDTTLSSTKTSLTASEFNDLKTIAANLNNGMSCSAALTYDLNALVDGNAMNATWTGGAATSVALGNLGVGSSATQLSELNGKWLLGTDTPSSKVSVDGSSFSVSYSNDSSPLFSASGPSMNDINQGYLGDCYLLADLAEVAKQNPSVISSMITTLGNGAYDVKFDIGGKAEYVTVDTALADGGTIFDYSSSDIWGQLVEKAYAQLQAGGVVTGNSVNDGNSYSTIGNGGAPWDTLEEITGSSSITNFQASGSSWNTYVYNQSMSVTGYSTGASSQSVLDALISDLNKGDDVVLTSYTNATDSSGKTTLVASHAMSVYGYDASTGMLEIRNPWGTEPGQTWDTTFEVSLSTLLADGDVLSVDNIGTGNALSAPTLTAQTATQTWKLGQSVNFTLAANTFVDPQGQALTYSATLSNGAALPSWLTFNAATKTFTGTVPNTATGLSVTVTAKDASGLSTSETFSVVTPGSAPVVTAQTATQNSTEGQTVSFSLAANTFTDPQGEKLTYSATQSNGAALPSWLTFNASTDTFSGKAPTTASSFAITVKATDTSGLSASETFSVSVAAPASNGGKVSATPPGAGDAVANFNPTLLNQYSASAFGSDSHGYLASEHSWTSDGTQQGQWQPHQFAAANQNQQQQMAG